MINTENDRVNADSTVPLYQQLKDHVLGNIRTGDLRPRDRAPSEQELVAQFGVSRMTANRALRELADDGYLVRQIGVGTFVAEVHARSHALQVRNIAHEIVARGHQHTARVVSRERVCAGAGIEQQLIVPPDASLFHTLIIHHENGRPIQAEDRYVLPDAVPDYLQQDYTQITPNEYLSRIAPLQTVEHIISARIPDESIRRLLEMQEGEPSLVIDRLTWSDDRPVSVARLHHPASRYELTASFGAADSGQRRGVSRRASRSHLQTNLSSGDSHDS